MHIRPGIFASLCLVTISLAAVATPVSAAPPAASERVNAQIEQYRALMVELADIEKKDPAKAIPRYKKFWEDNADLDPVLGIVVCQKITELYRAAKDPDTAISTCNWGIDQYKHRVERIRLINLEARILVDQVKTDAAQALLEKYWVLGMINGNATAKETLDAYQAALHQQLKDSQMAERIKDTFRHYPVYLGEDGWGPGAALYEHLIKELIREKRTEEAKAWAKFRLQLCPFVAATVKDDAARFAALCPGTLATTMAAAPTQRRVFGAPSGGSTAAVVTDTALTIHLTPQQKTILSQLAPPADAIDAAFIDQRLKAVHRDNEQQRTERVTLFLARGAYRSAMDEALLYVKDVSASQNAPRQVARVFKAFDLDTVRANAYLEYRKTGKRVDPLPSFLKDMPQDEAPTQ